MHKISCEHRGHFSRVNCLYVHKEANPFSRLQQNVVWVIIFYYSLIQSLHIQNHPQSGPPESPTHGPPACWYTGLAHGVCVSPLPGLGVVALSRRQRSAFSVQEKQQGDSSLLLGLSPSETHTHYNQLTLALVLQHTSQQVNTGLTTHSRVALLHRKRW